MEGNVSLKSYGTAVGLCGVFGMLGIHHFYIGNILHGIFDLSLLITGTLLLFSSEYGALGMLLLLIDAIHTIIVFFRLIGERQKDGYGKLIVLKVHKNSDTE
jgi:TM2 domain-containing membrane protein YozV